jgi:hypothetical protein
LEENIIGSFSRNWDTVRGRFTNQRYSMDIWHGCLSLTRQYLRGWNDNRLSQTRKSKEDLLAKLKELDVARESHAKDSVIWSQRYHLEARLEKKLS